MGEQVAARILNDTAKADQIKPRLPVGPRRCGHFWGKRSRYEAKARFTEGGTNKERSKRRYGGVAQLGEHLPCKQGVMSSNLTISTAAVSKGKAAQVVALQRSKEAAVSRERKRVH